MGRICTLFFILLVCVSSAFAERENIAPGSKTQARHYFIENKGQITDQNATQRHDINFKLHGGNISVFIGSGQLHYQWYQTETKQDTVKDIATTYRLDVELLGADKNAEIITGNKQAYREHYYTDAMDATAFAFNQVTYKNVYPNIDWVLYCDKNGLKYDFVVRPGGKVSDIRIRYNGTTAIGLINSDLKVSTPAGSIIEKSPYSYTKENNRTILSSYRLDDNVLSFNVADYEGTLVIDPVIGWASYYGDNNYDAGNAIASDIRGNVYLAGTTSSISNIATVGAHQVTLSGQYDVFLAAFDIDGIRKWATYFGGSDFDYCHDAVCDTFGNIFITGKTSSISGITTLGSFQPVYGGGVDDGFICRFDKNGNRNWATYFGGPGSDAVNNINCEGLGNLFIGGNTTSPSGIAYINAYQLNIAGLSDGFMARFNGAGQRQWSTYFGGPDVDAINFTSPDRFGNVYAYGTTLSTTGISLGGVHQTTINTTSPTSFLTKFDLVGNAVWSTYFGGASGATPAGLTNDAAGNIYICGFTTSNSGIATIPAQQPAKNTGEDGYLSKFNPNGTQLWGTYYGNAGQDNFTGLSINSKDQLFLSGITTSATGMVTAGALQASIAGTQDAFYTQWDGSGVLLYSSYFGGNNIESISATGIGSYIDCNFGKAYLCGSTTSTTAIATANGHQLSYGGGPADAFAASFVFDTIVYILPVFSDTVLCEGSSFIVPYKTSLPFPPGTIFSVQLSDGTGHFNSPVVIGTANAANAGNIPCQIPLGTPVDTSYRIRIISNVLIYTSADNGADIQIDNIPPQPIISNSSPTCIDDTLKLSVLNAVTGVSYFWNGPGFSGYANSVTFNKAGLGIEGVYNITPSINACTGQDATTVVTLKPTPHIISSASNTPICEGTNITLTAQSDSINVTYNWIGPGFAASTQNAQVTNTTVSSGGLYTVTATYNGCPSKKDSLFVNVKRNPVLNTTSNSPVCDGDSLVLNTIDMDGQTQYSWTGPANFISSTANNSIAPVTLAATGKYYIIATNNGCTGNDTIDVLVKPLPFPVAGNNSPICSGEHLLLTVTTNNTATKYNWYGPDDFNKTEQNPEIKHAGVVARGLYRIIANLNGCIQEDTTVVTINQAPVTVLASNSPVYRTQELNVYASNNLSGAMYNWTGPAGFTSTDQNLRFAEAGLAQSGVYYLKTDYMGCTSTDSIFVVIYNIVEGDFILFPNPNNGNFTIRTVTISDDELPIGIWDAAGRLVYSASVKGKNKLIDENVTLAGRLASGVYILKVKMAGGTIKRKFTVIR